MLQELYQKNKDIEDFLTDPMLFYYYTEGELSKTIVGEDLTKKAIFLSCCGIWVQGAQINTFVNSESSAGKSFICRRIIELFPKNLREDYTKVSPEAFTYLHAGEPDFSWNGKLCYLEDARKSLLESETFKVMCSEGTKAVIANAKLGIAREIEVKGKPCFLLTTAQNTVSDEILNRFNMITLDESAEQTEAIKRYISQQAMTGKSLTYEDKAIVALNFLKRIKVKIPFAPKLDKYIPTAFLRIRRDYLRFLDLIRSSCALHQYQRENEEDETTGEPIYLACNRDYEIAREIFPKLKNQIYNLTSRERRIHDLCKKAMEIWPEGFMVKEIAAKFPIVNEKSWYDNLDKLAQKGLLAVELKPKEDANNKLTRVYFTIDEKNLINLPKYDEL